MSLTPLIKFKRVLMGYPGARGTLIYEKKFDVEYLVSDSLYSLTFCSAAHGTKNLRRLLF